MFIPRGIARHCSGAQTEAIEPGDMRAIDTSRIDQMLISDALQP